jgi:ABC-type multidrug transport system ATPase subunit
MDNHISVQFNLRGIATFGTGPKCCNIPGIEGFRRKHFALKRRNVRLFVKSFNGADLFLNDHKLKFHGWIEIARSDIIKVGTLKVELDLQSAVFDDRNYVSLATQKLFFKVTPLVALDLQFSLFNSINSVCLAIQKYLVKASKFIGLKKIVFRTRILTDNAFVKLRPGSITAIMGTSGCGKSVFIKLLTRYLHPSKGKIFWSEYNKIGKLLSIVDLRKNSYVARECLGYVPQAEVMFPELTVKQSLRYRLKLRFPTMRRRVMDKYIEEACIPLGFVNKELKDFLNTRIGRSEDKGKILSGGQRRRANIIHELVVKPQILLLDEPTSGLSSYDADLVMNALSNLAKNEKIAVALVIHQPSDYSYKTFNNLLLLGIGGRVLYYGDSAKAIDYFEDINQDVFGKINEVIPQGHNPAEFILRVCNKLGVENASGKFRAFMLASDSEDSNAFKPLASSLKQKKNWNLFHSVLRRIHRFISKFNEFNILVKRGFKVFFADRGGLFLTFAQIPIIATLMFLAFHNLYDDHNEVNLAYRKHFCLLEEIKVAEQNWQDTKNDDVPVEFDKDETGSKIDYFMADSQKKKDKILSDAIFDYREYIDNFPGKYTSAQIETNVADKTKQITDFNEKHQYVHDKISFSSASQRGVVLFALILAAIWFGTIGSCIDIVRERAIFSREKKTCVSVSTYLLSKTFIKVCITGVQVIVLLCCILGFPMLAELYGLENSVFFSTKLLDVADIFSFAKNIFVILWVVAAVSSCLGLFVSAFATTERMALMSIPMLLIPQILFGGVLRPDGLVKTSEFPRLMGKFTIQRWAFDAALSCDPYAKANVLKQVEAKDNPIDYYYYWEARLVELEDIGVQKIYFDEYAAGFYKSLLILLGMGAGLFFGTYFMLLLKE